MISPKNRVIYDTDTQSIGIIANKNAKSHTADIATWLLKSKILSQNTVFCEGCVADLAYPHPLTNFDRYFTLSISHNSEKIKGVRKIL